MAVGGLLLAALALQIAALATPFLELSIFLKGTTVYGLWESVRLLREEGLYVIAGIIVSFSIIFPFVKLLLLAIAWFVIRSPLLRARVLALLGTLGKWSMIDPFCVILLVGIASGQWAVGASTQVGVYCFFSAIVLSMSLSIWMTVLHRRASPAREPRAQTSFRIVQKGGWASPLVGFLLLLSLACLVLAVDLPFLQVDQFLLHSNAVGVADLCIELAKSKQWALATLASLGLIIVPALLVGVETWWFLTRATPVRHVARRHFANFLAEWAMLDVFCLALVLFLLEGSRFIQTEARLGLWLIAASAFLFIAARRVAHAVALRCLKLRTIDDPAP